MAAWKVGAFVVLFVGLMLAALAFLEQSVFARPVDVYYAEFEDAGGIATGSAVLLSGVHVGNVREVSLVKPGTARLTLEIWRPTRLPLGSQALLPASLISIGDQRVQIVPPAKPEGFLEVGGTIPGKLGSPLDSLSPDTGEVLKNLNATLEATQKLLADKELKSGATELMANAADTAKKFGDLAARIDTLVVRNQDQFAKMLVSASSSLENLRLVSKEVQKLVASGELQGKSKALLDNLDGAVSDGRRLVAELQAFAVDPELKDSLKQTLANVKLASESGPKIAADAEAMAKNGVTITEETVLLMRKANALADDVQQIVEKFNKTVDKFSSGAKSMGQNIEVEATLARESNPGRFRTDVTASVPIGKDKAVVGFYDAFESNKLTAQLQRKLSPNLDFRYGAYASKPGIGVDFATADRVSFRGDLFGLNDPQFDARLRYDFGGGVYGWTGIERVFEKNSPAAGVSVRR
jgi:phospholipid/cholesterol/gamma-HCH transport system substrate-binding protein